jgi:sterol desaturase/sphingolipid hydroxylase (fatty acid hydroxylase superfamily)
VLVLGLGVTPEAAMVVNTCSVLLTMFQHANLRTPRWVGYFVQRPEGHLVHHGRGVHAFNYGDIALWDQVFGTFRNPEESDVPARAGFYDGASKRIGPMLLGRDVSAPSARKPAYSATKESRLGSVTHNAL